MVERYYRCRILQIAFPNRTQKHFTLHSHRYWQNPTNCHAYEPGYPNPVSARERVVGSKTETVLQNSKCQGDFGITDVLGAESVALIELTVSDGGGSNLKPGESYLPGAHLQRNAALAAKRDNYVGDKLTGILEKQLIVLSWDVMGGTTEETYKFLQIANQSIAA